MRPSFVTSLSEKAKGGELSPCVGRDAEIDQLIRVVAGDKAGNALLVAPPGCGKTELVRGLTLKLAQENPAIEVFEVDQTFLAADTKYIGEIERKLGELFSYAAEDKSRIFFIDEFHSLIGLGSHDSKPAGIEQNLKAALTAGNIRIIAATTDYEFKAIVSRDAALARRFSRVDIPELSDQATLEILRQKNHLSRIAGEPHFEETALVCILVHSAATDANVANPARSLRLFSELQSKNPASSRLRINGDGIALLERSAILLEADSTWEKLGPLMRGAFHGVPNSPVKCEEVEKQLSQMSSKAA